MALHATKSDEEIVGRTPPSAAGPLAGLFDAPASRTRASGADQGVRPTASSTERLMPEKTEIHDRNYLLIQRLHAGHRQLDPVHARHSRDVKRLAVVAP